MINIIEIGKESMISDNHLIKTDKGWVKAKELKVGDKIFNFEGKITKIEKLPKKLKKKED